MKNKESRGMALISIVISLLIAAIIIFAALSFYKGRKGSEDDIITSPIDRSVKIQCLTQIRRIETAIQMYSAESGGYPSSLGELKNLSDTDLYCPVTNKPYDYDPGAGGVTCLDHPE